MRLPFTLSLSTVCLGLCIAFLVPLHAGGVEEESRRVDIYEYQIDGVYVLPALTVERAVYPYLGEARTADDVELARAALEKAYHTAGFQSVSVQIPPQEVKEGVVVLQVIEGTVGRLRVNGSRHFDLNQIKAAAPSLAEGTTPNFNAVTQDILALNQLPDRRVTPALRAGIAPGTVDVDLNVEDTLPLHGSVELNNRHSANTKPLRLNGSISYNNLWQREHTLGFSFQIAPERLEDAKVFSGFYLTRLPAVRWLSFMLQAVRQDSDVSTIGGIGVTGRGNIVGARATINLPARNAYFHSLSLGIDRKHFEEGLTLGSDTTRTPITYYPLSVAYTATRQGKGMMTQFNLGSTIHLRGLGSDPAEWDAKRYKSRGSFATLQADVSHTRDLPAGLQLFGRVQSQVASRALLSSEQFSLGGLDTVRGYLESEAMGDNGYVGTLELRGPQITLGGLLDDLRFHVFADGGEVSLWSALSEQEDHLSLGSFGAGARLRFYKYLNGSIDVGVPLRRRPGTKAYDPNVTFRLWGEF